MIRAAATLALALAAMPAEAAWRTTNWRRDATSADRERVRSWRRAWVEALDLARRGGAGARIDAEPVLFDPDRALPKPVPPPGDYRCRTVKLGGRGGATLPLVAYDWFACRIEPEQGGVQRFVRRDGSQRPDGYIYADTNARAVFLGTLLLGDETRPMRYGRDAARDMAGLIERIGPARWRLVLPYPRFESTLDIIELVPAD